MSCRRRGLHNIMRYYFLCLISFCFLGTMSAQESLKKLLDRYNSHGIPYISAEEMKMLLKENNTTILDAREKIEFDVSHIPTAKHIGFHQFSTQNDLLPKLNKNQLILVYCSIGIRSEKIAEKLKRSGFVNVKNLYGGIFEWKNKGFQVVDSTGRKTENIHVFSEKWSQWLHSGNPIY